MVWTNTGKCVYQGGENAPSIKKEDTAMTLYMDTKWHLGPAFFCVCVNSLRALSRLVQCIHVRADTSFSLVALFSGFRPLKFFVFSYKHSPIRLQLLPVSEY